MSKLAQLGRDLMHIHLDSFFSHHSSNYTSPKVFGRVLADSPRLGVAYPYPSAPSGLQVLTVLSRV